MGAKEKIQNNIDRLTKNHAELDAKILSLELELGECDIKVRKMKKRKLALKDAITDLKDKLSVLNAPSHSAIVHELNIPRSPEIESLPKRKIATG